MSLLFPLSYFYNLKYSFCRRRLDISQQAIVLLSSNITIKYCKLKKREEWAFIRLMRFVTDGRNYYYDEVYSVLDLNGMSQVEEEWEDMRRERQLHRYWTSSVETEREKDEDVMGEGVKPSWRWREREGHRCYPEHNMFRHRDSCKGRWYFQDDLIKITNVIHVREREKMQDWPTCVQQGIIQLHRCTMQRMMQQLQTWISSRGRDTCDHDLRLSISWYNSVELTSWNEWEYCENCTSESMSENDWRPSSYSVNMNYRRDHSSTPYKSINRGRKIEAGISTNPLAV